MKDDKLKQILNTVLHEIMSVLGAECGSLFLFDYARKELVLDSLYNGSELHLTGLRQSLGQGIAGKVADIKEPVLVKDINLDSRFQRNGFKHYHTNSFISIPLITSKGLVGVLNVADKSDGKAFDEKDLKFASFICRYAGIAIEVSSNYNELKEEKDDIDRQKMLLEKYASVGKLAAGVVHEINNPLDGIIRYTNILLGPMESTVTREYLLEVRKGLSRIASITHSLLEFSHIINNGAHNKKYVDVNELIDENLQSIISVSGPNIRLNKSYRKDLPRILDIGLSHVFSNLIRNAIDAMSGQGTLDVKTALGESMVKISFKDTGVGIPDEIKSRIFEPFFTTKAIDKGTGLGLAICKEIVGKYEGKIEVDSAPGKGTIFNILIPNKYLEHGQTKL